MNQLATKMCLSDKVFDSKLVVLEDFAYDGKTKFVANLRKILPGFGHSTLWLMPKKDEKFVKAAHNVTKVDLKMAKDVSVKDLLNHQYIIVTKKGIEQIEKRLSR